MTKKMSLSNGSATVTWILDTETDVLERIDSQTNERVTTTACEWDIETSVLATAYWSGTSTHLV